MMAYLVLFVLTLFLSPHLEHPIHANETQITGNFENPAPDSYQSGIGILSGWACEAEKVTFRIGEDEEYLFYQGSYGTERLDTLAVCGDTDNGFGLLFNWNLLGDGEHEVVAFVDDVELGSSTVTVTTLGEEFLRGVGGIYELEDFPTEGESIALEWQQALQNFTIVEREGGEDYEPVKEEQAPEDIQNKDNGPSGNSGGGGGGGTPVDTSGSRSTPTTPPSETVVALLDGESAVSSIREGSSFLVRVQFEGVAPTEGGCTLNVVDSNGETTSAYALTNGDDASTGPISTTHDNEEDDGRTITVTVGECSFPDLDQINHSYRIGRRSITIQVSTAGPWDEDRIYGTWTVWITDIKWVPEVFYDRDNAPRIAYVLTYELSAPAPVALQIGYISPGSGWGGRGWIEIPEGTTGATVEHWLPSNAVPGEEFTVSVTFEELVKYESKPGGTFSVGSPRTMTTQSFTVPELEELDPEFTISLSGGTAAGEEVTVRVEASEYRDGTSFSLIVNMFDSWRLPNEGYSYGGRLEDTGVYERAIPIREWRSDDQPWKWLDEDVRPEQRTLTFKVFYGRELVATTTWDVDTE